MSAVGPFFPYIPFLPKFCSEPSTDGGSSDLPPSSIKPLLSDTEDADSEI